MGNECECRFGVGVRIMDFFLKHGQIKEISEEVAKNANYISRTWKALHEF